MEQDEYLVLEGTLDRGGQFTLRRGRSAPRVRRWPEVVASPLSIELVDSNEGVVHREAAELVMSTVCTPLAVPDWKVRAVIKLRKEAVATRLVHEGRVIWSRRLPDRPELSIVQSGTRLRKGRQLLVRLRMSRPEEGAWLALVYQWGQRKHRVVYLGTPKGEVEVDLGQMPGGDACRILGTYSNGLRCAAAAGKPFEVPRLGPSLSIVQPAAGFMGAYGIPLVLQAAVLDEERQGGAKFEDLSWFVDGARVGTGLMAVTEVLEVGRHEVALRYAGPVHREVTGEFFVERQSAVPIAKDWADWDPITGAEGR